MVSCWKDMNQSASESDISSQKPMASIYLSNYQLENPQLQQQERQGHDGVNLAKKKKQTTLIAKIMKCY